MHLLRRYVYEPEYIVFAEIGAIPGCIPELIMEMSLELHSGAYVSGADSRVYSGAFSGVAFQN